MSDIISFPNGLADAILDERVLAINRAEEEGEQGWLIQYDPQFVGEPGSDLFKTAAFLYAFGLKESGWLHRPEGMPDVIGVPGVRPIIPHVANEALGTDWQQRTKTGTASYTAANDEPRPVIILDSLLDADSIIFAHEVDLRRPVLGILALVGAVRPEVRMAIEQTIGNENVRYFVSMEDIVRRAILRRHEGIKLRDGIPLLYALHLNDETPSL